MKAFFTSDFTKVNKENRKNQQKLQIIRAMAQSTGGIIVPEICKMLQISPPTALKLVREMQEEGFIMAVGKKETVNGRKPLIYSLRHINLYAISVEILLKRISVAIVDMQLDVKCYRQNSDFLLENNQECLNKVEEFILNCLNESGIREDNIIGMGIGITGRVSKDMGESLTYFNFMGVPLQEYFSGKFDIPVFINNDTRCFAQAEKIVGKARDANHAVVINLSRGLGTGLIIDNKIMNGSNGFAGEMGHMKFGEREKLCICGEKGCLGNDVGGFALEEMFSERIAAGERTTINFPEGKMKVRYDAVLAAALEGDDLSIRLIREIGFKLGGALGNIINLLNPELVIIAGKFSRTKDILLKPLKEGIASTGLKNPVKTCQIEFSELGYLGGLKGAAALVFEYFELIKQ